tara:strand:+ start:1836 stop:2039 length:204 start_codon:yes stop_codon:yes gene_type:complete
VLFNVVCWHLALHLRISQILYEKMDDLYDLETSNHRLLFIFKIENSLQEAPEGSWTNLKNQLKIAKL